MFGKLILTLVVYNINQVITFVNFIHVSTTVIITLPRRLFRSKYNDFFVQYLRHYCEHWWGPCVRVCDWVCAECWNYVHLNITCNDSDSLFLKLIPQQKELKRLSLQMLWRTHIHTRTRTDTVSPTKDACVAICVIFRRTYCLYVWSGIGCHSWREWISSGNPPLILAGALCIWKQFCVQIISSTRLN